MGTPPEPENRTPGPGGRRTPGTPQAFPEQGASTLMRLARIVFMANEVKRELDFIRQMKPNWQSIIRVSDGWFRAAGEYAMSLERIFEAWNHVDPKWNGDGYDAFKDYMRFGVTVVAVENKSVLTDSANLLVDIFDEAVRGYNDAVKQMGEVIQKAAAIDPEKEESALLHMLTQFVSNNESRRSTLSTSLALKQGRMSVLAGQVQQLRVPAEFPKDAIDKNKWTYDPK